MNWKIPLFKTYWEENDVDAVAKVIRRGSFWTTGPEIEKLEQGIAKYVDSKYALTFNSGTSALHADLLAHGIIDGEVIVPSFTFISTANAVVLAGNKPVFAEIEEESYGLDPEDVKEKITKKTKAVMPIHYGGAPCKEIKALKEIAEDNKLILIEDAAESLGSKIDGKMVGTFGDSSMFSFCQNKIITAGEGGVIVTNSKDIYKKLKLLRSHGRVEDKQEFFSTTKKLDYIQVGHNYRMSSISASLILSQLNKINKIINLRRKKAKYYNKKLSGIKDIKRPIDSNDFYNVYQMYTIQLKDNKTRDMLQKQLEKVKIMTKVYFNPIHLERFYKEEYNYKKGDLPRTEEISKKVLTLPMYPALENKEIDCIINEMKKLL